MSLKRANDDDSKKKLAKLVAHYLLGDSQKGIEPLSISEISKIMGFKSRKSVYQYRDLAVELGLLSLDDDGKPILPKKSSSAEFKQFNENHKLAQDPYVEYWFKKQLNKKGGKGVKIAKSMFNMLERFFNTLEITPAMLVEQKNPKIVEDFRDEFLDHYRNGTDKRQALGMKRGNIETLNLRVNYALASFCAVHGISWARGDPAMSRKIVGHGQYANIRLTKKELEIANEYLKNKYGLDSDIYRWFWVGVESCARFQALFNMKLQYDIVENSAGKEYLVMQVFESKTEHINKGIQEKYIKRAETIEALKKLKKRGGSRIYENKDNLNNVNLRKFFNEAMKDLFRELGKDEESYFFKKPAHVLRHIGAHRLLEFGNYANHSLVAKLGGWTVTDELIKSYGAIPHEKIIEELDKYE